MVQPADHREGDDLPPVGGLALAAFGGVLVEREVGPRSVIALEVRPQDAPQVLLCENDDVLEAAPPKGSHSIRINDQWRVVFAWKGSDAYEVEVVDYHR